MLAIEIQTPGPNGQLEPTERPTPVLTAGEVLVQVAAAGVNRPDLLQRRGLYPPPPGASDIPGLEVAGTIVELGPGVTEWKAGDRVMALVSGGGYAELVNVPAGQCLRVPEPLSLEEAAALPEGLFTVYANAFELGALERGGSLLVHGGSSGIGTLAISMAKLAGARVFTTSRSESKRAACARLGADRAWRMPDEDFVAGVRDATNGAGVDVVLDMVGRDYFERNLAALADGGRHVSIAFLTGRHAELDLFALMQRRLVLTGSTLRARSVAEKTRLRDALEQRFSLPLANGSLRPVIAEVLPLADAERAHQRLEAGDIIGKLVLRP